MARFAETLEGQLIRPQLVDPTITGAVTYEITQLDLTGTLDVAGASALGGTLAVTGATTTARLLAAGLVVRRLTTTDVATAGDATFAAAAVLGGRITRDPAGSNRSDTLPTGTLLDAGDAALATGDSFTCVIDNTADAAETITLGMGAGLTNRGAAITIAQNVSAVLQLVKTGTATYNVYRLA